MRWLLWFVIPILSLGTMAYAQHGAMGEKRIRFPKTDYLLARTDSLGNIIWCKTYSNGHASRIRSALSTRSGGFAALGRADSCENGCWLIVTDENGDLLWERCYQGSRKMSFVYPSTFLQMQDGRYIIAGPMNNSSSAWLFCLSENGDILWWRTYNTGECRAAVPCDDGGFVLAGFSRPNKAPYEDGWILKTDSEGHQQWLQSYDHSFADFFYDATVMADGSIVAVGESYDDDHPESRESDGWVVIVDQFGKTIADRVYGKTRGIRLWIVQEAPDSGLLLTGIISQNKVQPWSPGHQLVMKISEQGDSLWSYFVGFNDHVPDSVILQNEQEPLASYLRRTIQQSHSQNKPDLINMTVPFAVPEQLRARGYNGRIWLSSAGVYNGGYFFAGYHQHPKSTDSAKNQ